MIHSFKIADTITANRAVYISASNTVAVLNTTTSMPIGITVESRGYTATGVAVACTGEIARLYFNDSCTATQLVGVDNSGRGIGITYGLTSTAISVTAAYIGVLVDGKVNATGTLARVLIQPGFARTAG